MDSGNNRAIKTILDAEHQKWKAERESSKTWGKRRRKEQDRHTMVLSQYAMRRHMKLKCVF